jgi:hypothetical protein
MLPYIIVVEIRVPSQAIPLANFVDVLAVGQVSLLVLPFSSVSIVPSVLHTSISLIYLRRYVILLATDSVFY